MSNTTITPIQAFNTWGRIHLFDPKNLTPALRELEDQLVMAEKFQEPLVEQPLASLRMDEDGRYVLHQVGGAAILEAMASGVADFDAIWVLDAQGENERDRLAWGFAVGSVKTAYDDHQEPHFYAELYANVAKGLHSAWGNSGLPSRSSLTGDRMDALEWLVTMSTDERLDVALEGLSIGRPEATRQLVAEDLDKTWRMTCMNQSRPMPAVTDAPAGRWAFSS
ncbi:hypothetical protein [Thioalkalivibrio sp. ALE16]|uniref:hypothetical protein n=1 Tax=Thioalkalivibrio sp. ALE16 TaxID=1158172 RepID=UPI000369210B|nr:hypothetical protein [Thioalkalivibrio sp. ALE16]